MHRASAPPSGRMQPGLMLVVSLVLLCAATAASFLLGSRPIPLSTLHRIVDLEPAFGSFAGVPEMDRAVLRSRIPRTITAVCVGSALAVAGCAMQGLSRNPLGDPGLLGLGAGAAAGVVFGLGFGPSSSSAAITLYALVGTAGAGAAVYGAARLRGGSPSAITLTLSGAAVGAGLSAVTGVVVLTHLEVLDRYRFWNVGSVSRAGAEDFAATAVLLVIGLILVVANAPTMNALALGESMAHSLGANLSVRKFSLFCAIVMLSAAATALAGPIGFVGLIVPHAIRRMVGGDYRWLVILSALFGPSLVLTADVAGRIIAPPQEIYVGIMTVAVGVPILLVLLRRKGVRL